MKRPLKILFDFDDVLNDLSKKWIAELNRRYHQSVSWEELTDFDLTKAFPKLSAYQIFLPYLEGTVYLDINPVREAQQLVEELSAEHELYVATLNLLGLNAVDLYEYLWNGETTHCVDYLLQFLAEYYPQISHKNLLLVGKKEMLRGDVLIDDNPDYLMRFDGLRILLDKPYNKSFDESAHGIRRAMTYKDIKRIVEEACI